MAIPDERFVEVTTNVIGAGGGGGAEGGEENPPITITAFWGQILGNIEDQADLIALLESISPGGEWGGIVGNIEDQADLITLVANAVETAVNEANTDAATAIAAALQIKEVTTAQFATIVAAGVPADKKLVYRTTDSGFTNIWTWNGVRFQNLARAGKPYDGAPSVARHAQRYACPNNTQGVRVLPLNTNVRKLIVRNKSAFIIQVSQAKYLSNDDLNIPAGGWVDIPVGNKATIWFPRGQVWCRYKTAAENNNIASIYAETEFIT